VAVAQEAKGAVRELYDCQDQALALEWIDLLVEDLTDSLRPPEVRSLGRTLKRWRLETIPWVACHFTNGPFEVINNFIEGAKRVALGSRKFRNYRIRALLYVSKPNWNLLATLTLRCNPMCLLNAVPSMGDVMIR
jgi:transposase